MAVAWCNSTATMFVPDSRPEPAVENECTTGIVSSGVLIVVDASVEPLTGPAGMLVRNTSAPFK